MAFALAVVIAPVSAKAEAKPNSSDLAALKKIVEQQNLTESHPIFLEDSTFNDYYNWTEINGELRLTSINWGMARLKGSLSLAAFPELTSFTCNEGELTKINVTKNNKLNFPIRF